MTKKQLQALRPGDRVRWVEPGTPDNGKEGSVRESHFSPGVGGIRFYGVRWEDQEWLNLEPSKAKYLKKLRN